MIYQNIALLVAAAASSAVAIDMLYSENTVHMRELFQEFKAKHQRNYSSEAEENHRFTTFVANLKLIDERNVDEIRNGGSPVHGVTKFADYTHSEFMRLNNADPSLQSASPKETLTSVPLTTTATSVDWTGKYTTPVKDQGYCGSCWAFSAAEQIESDAMRTLGYSTQLSPAQITQCDTRSSGCNGGWTEFAYNYVKGNRGLETGADYPYSASLYSGTTGRCAADYTKAKIGVNSYTTIKGETNMANYVLGTGPLSVCLDATLFNSYTGGIMTRCGTNVNHCVQAVGVNTGSGGYWKVRNSWGTGWGESGYIRLAYGQNTCAITNDPTYVSVYKV